MIAVRGQDIPEGSNLGLAIAGRKTIELWRCAKQKTRTKKIR